MSSVRLVVDSNKLRSEDLKEYLSRSADHFAVLTDYAWMEAYKGDSLVSIINSLAILRQFPEQVILLKGTKEVGALDARAPGLAQRMIWPGKDGKFEETVSGLIRAEAGDIRARSGILEHGRVAREQMDKLLSDATDIPAALAQFQRTFTASEIADIKAGRVFTRDFVDKIYFAAEYMALTFFGRHPLKPRMPTKNSLKNSFLFRYSLAMMIYTVDWIRRGSQLATNPEKLRNDAVDMNFATYATYFNGLLSGDKRANALHDELRTVLRLLGARVPPLMAGN